MFSIFYNFVIILFINTNIFNCGVCENIQIKNLFVQLKITYFVSEKLDKMGNAFQSS